MHEKDSQINFSSGDTLGVRVGHERTAFGEHSEAIFSTSSYVFTSSEEAAMRFSGEREGDIYSRYTNPTIRIFEQRISALEYGERAVATSSGMAAILSTCMALLSAGDHVVCSRDVFGTTTSLFDRYLTKFGIDITFVSLTDIDKWKESITRSTKMFFLETPSNPLCEVADISLLSTLAHKNNILLVVDNCFCTPALQTPLKLGADIVTHSATKYLDGQGRCVGGAVVGSETHMNEILAFLRTCGPAMSPFNAWVFLKGLETLNLRMERHSVSGYKIACWLRDRLEIDTVHYTGLETHTGHLLAKRQQKNYGGVLSFELKGGKTEAWRFIDAVQMLSRTANFGDAKSTIIHPATTTHGRLSKEEKLKCGIKNNLIRLSIGLEDVEDIINDLERGFASLV